MTLLLERGAPLKVKNALGWNPMSEAISYGDRHISMYCLLAIVDFSRPVTPRRLAVMSVLVTHHHAVAVHVETNIVRAFH